MRIVLSQQGWVFDGLSGLEWLFLQRLPVLVDELSADEGARLRLFPDPVREQDREARQGSGLDEDEEEIVDDWKEYVRPELQTLFDEACQVVATDLLAVQQGVVAVDADDEGAEKGEEQVFYSLEVKGDHVEQWNSTLNQVRLLMNEVYDLAESEKGLAESLLEQVEDSDEDAAASGKQRSRQADAYPQWLLLAQYGFYGAVQSFLIEQIMEI
ncbi:MAG: hypothetical protein L3J39_19145 [Verrucomicrobiales bacterium]|nr:hypothetical protein [Verrucomicrobiales bacterium]